MEILDFRRMDRADELPCTDQVIPAVAFSDEFMLTFLQDGIEGFGYERFFECFAHSWATVYSPAYANVLLVDAHAPANLRVNASAQMVDEFYSTYGAAEGDAMYLAPENRVAIWGKASG